MCGIVGLHLLEPDLEPRLGALVSTMLEAMTERGPDSAGVAIYVDDLGDPIPGPADGPLGVDGLPGSERVKYSLRADDPAFDWVELAAELGAELRPVGGNAVLVGDGAIWPRLEALAPLVRVVSAGHALEVFKDVGAPRDICDRYGVPARSGYQGVGHTRMATESDVTIDHSHPFSPALDLCVVHNGSFSNHYSVRRDLEQQGVSFVTDNDTEVAARLLAFEMARGADLGDALRALMKVMDGFYTLLVSTRDQFAVVRDAFACKPAAIAVTPQYIAMASEYRALAELPGVEAAEVFEPMPEEIHLWTRGGGRSIREAA